MESAHKAVEEFVDVDEQFIISILKEAKNIPLMDAEMELIASYEDPKAKKTMAGVVEEKRLGISMASLTKKLVALARRTSGEIIERRKKISDTAREEIEKFFSADDKDSVVKESPIYDDTLDIQQLLLKQALLIKLSEILNINSVLTWLRTLDNDKKMEYLVLLEDLRCPIFPTADLELAIGIKRSFNSNSPLQNIPAKGEVKNYVIRSQEEAKRLLQDLEDILGYLGG